MAQEARLYTDDARHYKPVGRLYAELAPETPTLYSSPVDTTGRLKLDEAYNRSAAYYEKHGEKTIVLHKELYTRFGPPEIKLQKRIKGNEREWVPFDNYKKFLEDWCEEPAVSDLLNSPIGPLLAEKISDAIRGKATLNCPPEVGYATAVTVLKVNEAVESGSRLAFGAADFTV